MLLYNYIPEKGKKHEACRGDFSSLTLTVSEGYTQAMSSLSSIWLSL
jgi:hypothetical protein